MQVDRRPRFYRMLDVLSPVGRVRACVRRVIKSRCCKVGQDSTRIEAVCTVLWLIVAAAMLFTNRMLGNSPSSQRSAIAQSDAFHKSQRQVVLSGVKHCKDCVYKGLCIVVICTMY